MSWVGRYWRLLLTCLFTHPKCSIVQNSSVGWWAVGDSFMKQAWKWVSDPNLVCVAFIPSQLKVHQQPQRLQKVTTKLGLVSLKLPNYLSPTHEVQTSIPLFFPNQCLQPFTNSNKYKDPVLTRVCIFIFFPLIYIFWLFFLFPLDTLNQ